METGLDKRIREIGFNLMLKERNGEPNLPINPFSPEELSFDYSKINPRYHSSANPNDYLTLYKGALRKREDKGFLSMALLNGLVSHVLEVREILEGSDDELIHDLFDLHTSYYYYTALLSSTLNPERAQVFASTHPLAKEKTIYQLRLKANRCVVDYFDTGGCGVGRELLILGAIFPEEISAVKLINDDAHSELLSPCGHYIRRLPDKCSENKSVKDVSNWRYLR